MHKKGIFCLRFTYCKLHLKTKQNKTQSIQWLTGSGHLPSSRWLTDCLVAGATRSFPIYSLFWWWGHRSYAQSTPRTIQDHYLFTKGKRLAIVKAKTQARFKLFVWLGLNLGLAQSGGCSTTTHHHVVSTSKANNKTHNPSMQVRKSTNPRVVTWKI